MKTREFRIGNILTDGKFMFTVESIEQEAVWGDIFECIKIERPEDCYDTGDYHFNIENIEGVPLTEEWLLKFGFDLFPWGWVHSTLKDKAVLIRCIITQDKYWVELGNGLRIDLPYVHTLQNFFALTNEELTYETT